MENNTLVWNNLVDAFLEDMKQFSIGDSLYAFVVAYNIAMKEMEVEESDKEYYDYVNDKTDLIWEEIGNLKKGIDTPKERINRLWMEFSILKQRVTDLESKSRVQPPSKMYPDWNNPNWTVTCNSGGKHYGNE